MLVIHITPDLPPATCGVGDYATLVGKKIEELQPDIRCAYVSCGSQVPREKPVGTAPYRVVNGSLNGSALWQAVEELADREPSENVALVLHYSGYGYQMNGAPAWLADAIEQRASAKAKHLLTFFHELYAPAWPWQRAFWVSGQQKKVAIRIAKSSNQLISNRFDSARWLEQKAGRAKGSVPHLPVCSNVGEPAELIQWTERANSAVLFGGAFFKKYFLTLQPNATIQACQQLGITSILDIGKSTAVDRQAFKRAGIVVEQTGILPAEDVSLRLQNSRFMFFDYFPGYLAKSGVLAAAASHGLVPLTYRDLQGVADGLSAGQQYISMQSLTTTSPSEADQRFSGVSLALQKWYEPHSLTRHAMAILSAFGVSNVSYSAQ